MKNKAFYKHMFLQLRLPQHSAYDDTFFWSRERRDTEVRLYLKSTPWQKVLLFKFRILSSELAKKFSSFWNIFLIILDLFIFSFLGGFPKWKG